MTNQYIGGEMNDALFAVLPIVVGGLLLVSAQNRLTALQRRLDRLSRIEGKLDAMLKHAGIRFDPLAGFPPDAMAAVRQGRKIEAIKHYRQATGVGLAEARDAVEEALRRGGA